MAGKGLNGVVQRLRTLAAAQSGRTCSDRELLGRFLAADEAAFSVLVERHAPMILGLCRRLLRDRDDADDACQATFLVLARNARSVRKQESLASWLHGVAHRVCMSLKRQTARRVKREQAAPRPAAGPADNDLGWREFRAVLDDELQRVPERYRGPLILCYLEGKTRDEAAQELGVKPATLHGLLDRGRKLLRARLSKRGLDFSTALGAVALAESTARAAPALVVKATHAAALLLRGDNIPASLIAPSVLSLVKEASKTMFITKLKIGVALVLAAGIWTGIMGGGLDATSLAQDTGAAKPKPPAAALQKTESDEEFIRRISQDLRGTDPSPTEVHFFTSSKEVNRRQKLVDLFIQERQAREPPTRVQAKNTVTGTIVELDVGRLMVMARPAHARRLITLQGDLLIDLSASLKDKKEVAALTQKYLEQLQEYVKAHTKNDDIADALRQIALIYRSQGKTVEADAWRDKLLKEHPQSPAAKAVQQSKAVQFLQHSIWVDLSNKIAPTPMYNFTREVLVGDYLFGTSLAPPAPPAPKKDEAKQEDNSNPR